MATIDPQVTGKALAKARSEAERVSDHFIRMDLARALRDHIAAHTRRSFPTAFGLVIYFPDLRTRRDLCARIASVIGPPPCRIATCPPPVG